MRYKVELGRERLDALGHDYAIRPFSILCALLRARIHKSSWAQASDGVGGCEQLGLQTCRAKS